MAKYFDVPAVPVVPEELGSKKRSRLEDTGDSHELSQHKKLEACATTNKSSNNSNNNINNNSSSNNNDDDYNTKKTNKKSHKKQKRENGECAISVSDESKLSKQTAQKKRENDWRQQCAQWLDSNVDA
jgi:hypothetical protein